MIILLNKPLNSYFKRVEVKEKEKSMKELDKTEEKQKEVFSILRERTAYLNNLEKERQQALKYKKLEADIKKFHILRITVLLVLKLNQTE